MNIVKKINVSALLLFVLSACGEPINSNKKTLPTGYIKRTPNGELIPGALQSKQISPVDQINIDNSGNIDILSGHLPPPPIPNPIRGGRLYDDLFIELALPAVLNDNPLLSIANPINGTTLTGTDTYKCANCHGYNYDGGIFNFQNSATNSLLELMSIRKKTRSEIIAMLSGGFEIWNGTSIQVVHDYGTLLDSQSLLDISDFVMSKIFDMNSYLRSSTSGSALNNTDGLALYNMPLIDATNRTVRMVRVDGSGFNCTMCHGLDGLGDINVSPNTTQFDLYALAWADPFKFYHRTLFGSPRNSTIYNPVNVDPNAMPGLLEVVFTNHYHFTTPAHAASIVNYVQTLR